MTSQTASLPPLLTHTIGLEVSPTLLGNQRVIERRAQWDKILHMGFGESPFPVAERLKKALTEHTCHKQYLGTAGLPQLRQNILTDYCDKFGLDPNAYDVIIAPGSKLFLFAMQMAYEGDLILPVPSWVSYEPQARMLGQKTVKVATDLDDTGYHLAPEKLRSAIIKARQNGLNPTKIIINTPNNPTGLRIPEAELEAIAAVCRNENIIIISDDIYGFVSFDKKLQTIASKAPERTVISSAISKHLSLGGWRLGFGLVPKAMPGLFDSLCQIASETWSAVSAPVQYAVCEAFDGNEDIETFITDCSDIHALMNSYIATRLKAAGIDCPMPQGAFYCYPDFGAHKNALAALGIQTSSELFVHLLDNYNLATLPGIAFGEESDSLTLRLSGCDYNGEKALEAYRAGTALDESFIIAHAPNIQVACDAFEAFAKKLRAL